MKYFGRLGLVTVALAFIGPSQAAESWTYQVLEERQRGSDAFTQGLEIHEGALYESGGLYGESFLRRIDLETGAESHRVSLPAEVFAEGLTIFSGRLYQLTWREERLFVYDAATLELLDTLTYQGEGWGLTHNDTSLIQSDGSNVLRFRDPVTFDVQSSITVRDGVTPIAQLNELEWVDDRIWANVWFDRRIAVIHPETGAVEAWIDLAPITRLWTNVFTGAVLNGIARDPKTGHFWVTGKRWPRLYRIRVAPLSAPLPEPTLEARPTHEAGVSLQFPSFYRARYQLESASAVERDTWSPEPMVFTGDGFLIEASIPPIVDAPRFWRLRVTEEP